MANELIYFVEDDNNIYELIDTTLKLNGFTSVGFYEPLEMIETVKKKLPDLLLLDLMLPNMSGYDVIKLFKAVPSYQNVPIIIVSAKFTENDIVTGLDLGANDYITKPFGIKEFISRIRSNLRKKVIVENSHQLLVGELKLDFDRHRAYVNDNPIDLTFTEFQLLEYLMKNCNQVMTRNRLLKEIWGYAEDTETRTLDMHIRSLREKIGRHTTKQYIETVRGVGYIINE